MKPYYVYTQKMCAELMLRGHKLIGIEPSKKREGFKVFVFISSEELRKDVDELVAARK